MKSLRYILLIKDGSLNSQGLFSAVKFAKALINKGHKVEVVFFYYDGVYSAMTAPTEQGRFDHCSALTELYQRHGVDLAVCRTAALRRGVIQEQTKGLGNIKISSLTELTQAIMRCDRYLEFGG